MTWIHQLNHYYSLTAPPLVALLPPFPQDILLQGLIAAEFLKLYGDACEARGMGLRELFISCAWPLDNPEFGKLLQQLLLVRAGEGVGGGKGAAGWLGLWAVSSRCRQRCGLVSKLPPTTQGLGLLLPLLCLQCCLLEQLNQEPPAKGRGKRWMRCLTGGCRHCNARPCAELVGLESCGAPRARLPTAMLLYGLQAQPLPRMHPLLADATWPEICRRYLLTSRTGKVASAPDEGGAAEHAVTCVCVEQAWQTACTRPSVGAIWPCLLITLPMT